MNQQRMSAKPTNPVPWVIFGIVVLAAVGGMWYVSGQGNGNANVANSTVNNLNREQIVIGKGQRYTSNGISLVIPTGWFLSNELSSKESPFVLSTYRGATSILGLPDRKGVVALVLQYDGIQENAVNEFVQKKEDDFRGRMPGSPSKLERVQLNGRIYWKWTTDTLATFEGEGSYGEAYFIPSKGTLIEIVATAYGKTEIEKNQVAIEAIVVSVE